MEETATAADDIETYTVKPFQAASGEAFCTKCPAGRGPVVEEDENGGFIRAGCDPCTSSQGQAGSLGWCEPCPPGTAPNTAGTQCVDCAFGKYSDDGTSCQACLPGEQPNCGDDDAQIEWQPNAVDATEVYEAHGAYAVGTTGVGCASCEACVDVVGASGYSTGGQQCLTCGNGKQPNADRSGCDDCGPGEYSNGSGCSACGAGTQPSTDKGSCESCAFIGDNKYSPGGEASCLECETGTQPNTERSSCEDCGAIGDGFISATGAACVQCAAGTAPDDSRGQCIPCLAGEASTGAECVPCSPGTASSSDRSRCESCRLQDTATAKFYSTDVEPICIMLRVFSRA
eukprot:COSAG02_NODE_14705_length_1245_cov_0.808901_2_plen_343_part_01